MAEMDLYKALSLEALSNVLLDGDKDYTMRFIKRWYSRTFSTPLAHVDDLPVIDVLRAFFEERYEGYSPEQLEEERARLCETDEECRVRKAAEAALEADEAEALSRAAIEEAARYARVEKKRQQRILEAQAQNNGLVTDSTSRTGPRLLEADEMRGGDTSVAATEEPVLKIEFPSDLEFDQQLDGHGTMGQPER